ncbi:MAG TPA: hypothetical protein VMZ53_01880 [Kofleriaceae bacterium]|nr:hypothetical protein [Kofleriaceae bacterium]
MDLGAMTLAGFLALSQVAKAIGGCEGAGGVECGEAALRNAAIIAGVGGVFFVSAIYGFAAKSSCHAKAKAAVSASGGTQ